MNTLPVFYTPRMVARPKSFSPSAGKPEAVVLDWQKRAFPVQIVAPEPMTRAELCAVHTPAFVDGILAGKIANGFGDTSTSVAASLLWTSGAMRSAARHALRERAVACAPCSGFHHARFDAADGYCTFNGLMASAHALHSEGARRIGILDCDMHEGDGTDEIIVRLGRPSWVQHITCGATYFAPDHAARFLEDLPELVRSFASCDVLLYQAGADPHLADPLGGFLSDAQLRTRDAIVFREARALGLPVAWNLAGGYQRDSHGGIQPVLEIHAQTVLAWRAAWVA